MVYLLALLAIDLPLLLLVLKPALKTEAKIRRGEFDWLSLSDYLGVVALVIGWFLDVWIAHTKWALMAGWPKEGETTISHTLERLCHTDNSGHPDYAFFCWLGNKINSLSPGHIKVLANG